jgi:hypothetical protein
MAEIKKRVSLHTLRHSFDVTSGEVVRLISVWPIVPFVVAGSGEVDPVRSGGKISRLFLVRYQTIADAVSPTG